MRARHSSAISEVVSCTALHNARNFYKVKFDAPCDDNGRHRQEFGSPSAPSGVTLVRPRVRRAASRASRHFIAVSRRPASQRSENAIIPRWLLVVYHTTRGGTLPEGRGHNWVPQHASSEFRGRVGRASSRPKLHRRRRRGLRAQGSDVRRSRCCCMSPRAEPRRWMYALRLHDARARDGTRDRARGIFFPNLGSSSSRRRRWCVWV